MTTDEELRDSLRRLAGPVDRSAVWSGIAAGAARRRKRRRLLRVGGLALAAAAVLVLALVGVPRLVDVLRPSPGVVITDDENIPGDEVQPGDSATAPGSFPTTTPHLDTFSVDGWKLTVLTDGEPMHAPVVDEGRVVWGRNTLAGFSAGVFLYDIDAQTVATVVEGVDTQSLDLEGDLLAYSGVNGAQLDIYLLNLFTRATKQISSNPGRDCNPELAGGFVVWREEPAGVVERVARILSYEVASGTTQVVVDVNDGWTVIDSYLVGDRWVVFTGLQPGTVALAVRAVRLGTDGDVRELPAGAEPQYIEGDDLYYVIDAEGVSELRCRNLASGDDQLVASGSLYQSVRVDSDHLAWATWEDGHAAIVYWDRTAGPEIHIPSPTGLVGQLLLEGNLLAWKRLPSPPQPSTDPPHLFVYDHARNTTTDLAQLYPVERWSSDGQSVVFPERRIVNGPVRLVLAQPAAQ